VPFYEASSQLAAVVRALLPVWRFNPRTAILAKPSDHEPSDYRQLTTNQDNILDFASHVHDNFGETTLPSFGKLCSPSSSSVCPSPAKEESRAIVLMRPDALGRLQ
jgi:hypothetical protein